MLCLYTYIDRNTGIEHSMLYLYVFLRMYVCMHATRVCVHEPNERLFFFGNVPLCLFFIRLLLSLHSFSLYVPSFESLFCVPIYLFVPPFISPSLLFLFFLSFFFFLHKKAWCTWIRLCAFWILGLALYYTLLYKSKTFSITFLGLALQHVYLYYTPPRLPYYAFSSRFGSECVSASVRPSCDLFTHMCNTHVHHDNIWLATCERTTKQCYFINVLKNIWSLYGV